ncbi:oligoendopeptidase F [Oscillochloris sp. ZM17-4]|uniref:oligoendopeptidase F n=1 Tax=Oscillochloris sp. ZM17-4 TaxID=2866714 RepID=UPI001C736FAF|nr:oligoendopeptidase F [Oscillochloris sp. ZM17-4]MBX0327241.1 oligoendopeptidase F [Oscillochloris sp. ZM17-4]
MTVALLRRDEVAAEHTWDLTHIFADIAAWEAEARRVEGALPDLSRFQGRMGESPGALLGWLQAWGELRVAAYALLSYALMSFDQDTSNQQMAALRERAFGLFSRCMAAAAFAEPELLAIDPARVESFLADEPALGIYAHYLSNLRRLGGHVRSGEVEQLLAAAGDALGTPYGAYQMLADGDLRFADATDSAGAPHQVARGTIDELLEHGDRALRKSAWESYADGFLSLRNSFGALYAGSVKGDVFLARARGYAGALEASLDKSNVPRAVYDTVIDACNRNLPIWHRYWDLRRRALGLGQMEACDIFAPLAKGPAVSYAEAVEMVCAGMAPLGEEYVRVARAGLTSERWVDIYPNRGKASGAYSGGGYGTPPFILMNYGDSLTSMSTLAHELGHSMHSWHTNRAQPAVYSDYTLFVAEVASNFNQAMVRGHLLAQGGSREFQIALIEEAMSNFHRYLFVMPILSQFEQQTHAWAEAGEAVTAERMGELLAELFARGYGPAVRVDPARDGIVWAQFPHLYSNFYVYQYASGIAAANALADGVLRGEAGAVERYLSFLSAGGSRYPLDALALAGIDMTSPAAMDRAFGVMAGFVDRLEGLIG